MLTYHISSDIRGGAQQDKVPGGLQPFCEQLVKEIGSDRVKLRHPVTRVSQTANGVTCHTAKDGSFSAKYLIVTAPPSVCSSIKFEPDLPVERKQLHERYAAGEVIKIYVLYKTNWWRPKGLSGEMLSDEEPVTLYYDATCEKKHGFIGFIPAHLAKKWGSVPAEELKKAITAQLVREYGQDAAHPHEILIRPWLHDDIWCRGAYAGSMPTNTLSRYGSILRKPVGRIHWACTELARDWVGYYEGAVESGQSTAHEVISKFHPATAKL